MDEHEKPDTPSEDIYESLPLAYSPILDLVIVSVTTASLMPFLQAISSKAGEDVWAAIRDRIPQRRRRRIERDLDATQAMQVIDVERRIIVRMPRVLPASAAPELAQLLQNLRDINRPLLISYQSGQATWDWMIADLSEPDVAAALRRSTRHGVDLPAHPDATALE